MSEDLSSLIRKSTHGGLVLICGQVLSTLISAIGSVIVARLLGSINYGVLYIANIPIMIALLFINNGIDQALINYLSLFRYERRINDARNIIYAGLIINVIISIFLTITVYFFSDYISNNIYFNAEIEPIIKILSVSIFANSLINLSYAIFIGYENMKLKSISQILYSLLKSVLGPLLIFLGYGVYGAAYGISLPLVIVSVFSIVLVIFIISKENHIKSSINLIEATRLIVTYSYPLFFSSLFLGGLHEFFNFILPIYVLTIYIGNYNAVLTFSVIINFLTIPISTALFPLFSKLDSKNIQDIKIVFQNSIKYLSMLTFPIITIIILLSSHITLILFSEDYMYAANYLKLYMINFYFIGFGTLTIGNLLNGQRKTKVMLIISILQVICGLPIGFLCIKYLGIVGLLITNIILSVVGISYALWWINKNYDFSIDWNFSLKLIFSTFFSYVILYRYINVVDENIVVELVTAGLLFIIIYSINLPIFGCISKDDVVTIDNITSNLGLMSKIIKIFIIFINKIFIIKENCLNLLNIKKETIHDENY